jgi:hypothetical protein
MGTVSAAATKSERHEQSLVAMLDNGFASGAAGVRVIRVEAITKLGTSRSGYAQAPVGFFFARSGGVLMGPHGSRIQVQLPLAWSGHGLTHSL